jgi:hypothetical protein
MFAGVKTTLSEAETTVMRNAMEDLKRIALVLNDEKTRKIVKDARYRKAVDLYMESLETFRSLFFDTPIQGMEWDNRRKT